ncbi:LysR family transcriptional regulator [Bacillus velezensis]|uniref:LysR family transcriptional regulator n=1 Tax=Bacillus velezensis TaxID=492670 RepID=UPI002415D52A|nr:LysR family transcriptional regulator [Bacillus velezensis]WFO88527.1 LysR family transcriptional regulator [Bacillus velezensis]
MNRYIAVQKIVELGSFTKAAEALGYTQSAMSQMIASLEEELSIKILNRSRVGVKLTVEGKELYPFIQKTISQYQALQEKANEIKGLESGTIRIGTISSISCHWLPRLINDFQTIYPNVQFLLHQGDYKTIPEWVRAGYLDFGFINPDAVTGLKTHFLKEGELKAVLPVDHVLAKQKFVTLNELSEEPFLLLEGGTLSEPLEAFHKNGLEPNVRICLHDDYSILSMIETGLGVSILPELVLRRIGYEVAILPINPPVTRKIGLVIKDKKTLPISSKIFIDHLIQEVNNLP